MRVDQITAKPCFCPLPLAQPRGGLGRGNAFGFWLLAFCFLLLALNPQRPTTTGTSLVA